VRDKLRRGDHAVRHVGGARTQALLASHEPAETLLCVDDEPSILAALRRVFRPHGYRILTAGSGDEALRILEHESVGVVISDMSMPGMDGRTLLDLVHRCSPAVVRLLLTGHSDAGVGAADRGTIYGYVAKPWDEDVLLVTVQHAFALYLRTVECPAKSLGADL
jgi:DNA-binding NtrC family response regulator